MDAQTNDTTEMGRKKKEKEEEKPVRIIFIYASNVGVC